MRIISYNNPYYCDHTHGEKLTSDVSGAFRGRLGTAEVLRKDAPHIKLVPTRRRRYVARSRKFTRRYNGY